MPTSESIDEVMMKGKARAYDAVDTITEKFYAEKRKKALQDIMLSFPPEIRAELVKRSPEARRIMDELGG